MNQWLTKIHSWCDFKKPYLLACSAGIDSVFLFHLLLENPPPNSLVVCHYDHKMRSESSLDAKFVASLCKKHDIPFLLDSAKIPPKSEEEARELRREFYYQSAKKIGATEVFLAHHQDDQIETLLLRLLRGGGLYSLQGMALRAALKNNIFLLRPLLDVSRAEIVGECQKRGIQFREDPSNQELHFLRNRIRHELLPLLKNLQPTVDRSLLRLMAQARQLPPVSVLSDLSFGSLEKLSSFLRPISLKHYLENKIEKKLNFSHMEQILMMLEKGQNGSQVSLPGSFTLIRAYDQFLLVPKASPFDINDNKKKLFCEIKEEDSGFQETPLFEIFWGTDLNIEADLILQFEPKMVQFPLLFRTRQSGDRIFSKGLKGKSHRVKKLLIEAKIPQVHRTFFPLLVDKEESVLWVPGIRIAEQIKGKGFCIALKKREPKTKA